MDLCIGTVQLGMDYGILGNKKPLLEEAVNWLDYATQNGIFAIDTARAYGTAEEVVGAFLAKKTISRERLCISTKLMPNILDDCKSDQYEKIIENELVKQLRILNTEYLDVYMYHSSRYAFDEEKLAAISSVKKKGMAKKVGVSVYDSEEAFACLDSPYVDFIQAPYSILDHRMKKEGIFSRCEISEKCMHVRSAFIQGLIMMEENKIPPYLNEARPIVKRIDKICRIEGISRVRLAMQYVKRESAVSHLVFGVDTLSQLKEDIEQFDKAIPSDIFEIIDMEFAAVGTDIVMPSLWKR